MFWKRNNSGLRNHVSQEFHGCVRKGALGRVDRQAIFLQHLEELGEMLHVFFHGSAGNQMIVQVCENKREVTKQAIHQPLESLSRVH